MAAGEDFLGGGFSGFLALRALSGLMVLVLGGLIFVGVGQALAQEKYVAQIMSLASEASAKSEADKLMAEGAPSFQRAEEVPGQGLRHRVYMGPFDTAAEAKAAAEALKSQSLIKEYIVRKEGETQAAGTGSGPNAASAAAVPSPIGAAVAPNQTAAEVAPGAAGSAVSPGSSPRASALADDLGGALALPPVAPSPSTGPPTGATPGPAPEYWPVSPAPMGPVVGNTNPNDWPPPGHGDDDWAAPARGGAAGAAPLGSTGSQEAWPASPGAGTTLGPAVEPQAIASTPALTAPPVAPSNPPIPGPATAPRAGVAPTTTESATVAPIGSPGAPGAQAGTIVPVAPDASPDWPPVAPAGPTNGKVLGDFPASTPVLPSGQVAVAPRGGATVIPGKATGPMKIQGFAILSDLSSSMRNLSACPGRLVKEEAARVLLRKMNQRIPSQPYVAALRVFGYKRAWTRKDYSRLYFGPAAYDRGAMETAIGRLNAADSISPFGSALEASESELKAMGDPKAIIMVSDFEATTDPGDPAAKARSLRRKHGQGLKVYAFYASSHKDAAKLAQEVAQAGGGQAYDMCNILDDEAQFEAMMTEIFGPRDLPPCRDSDSDGVCDERDQCPNTPKGAPADERGCWIAAYAQFFDFDKAEVKYAFQPRLKAAAEILVANPQLAEVTIAGHTDDKGTEAYNLELGQRRAEAVKELLVKFGAPAERLKTVSFGKTRPIVPNDTEENRAKNRRVEFHVGDVPK